MRLNFVVFSSGTGWFFKNTDYCLKAHYKLDLDIPASSVFGWFEEIIKHI
jgi:hypothetical protein